MKKIIMMVERSKDYFDAYSENCDGIYAAGASIDEVKADAEKAIELIKRTLPESQCPNEIKGDYEIEWKFDVASFLEYYSSFMSLAGMEKMTGINQKQLSNYLNHRAVPRKKQTERIREGIHKFAHELLSITLWAYAFYTGQLLHDARKEAKVTQAELAKRINSTKSYISRVENGDIIPSVAKFWEMITSLGMRLEIVK